MKHIKLFAIGLLLLSFGIAIGVAIQRRNIAPSKATENSAQPASITPAPGISSRFEGPIVVKRAVDGDTIELENGEKVRYIGIDTPETVDPRKPVQCFGKEASAKNKELVEGKQVWFKKDITDRDKYHRLLRYIYLGDPGKKNALFVNLELVKQGFAHSYSYPPDIAYQDEFIAAEKEARDANRGLWSSCSISLSSDSLTPYPSSQTHNSQPITSVCTIKGNISASGEKIYHLPGCGSYEKTAIDESRGEKWFCSEQDALAAGWRRAKNC